MAKKSNAPIFTDITNTKKGQPTEANLKSFAVQTNGQPDTVYTTGYVNTVVSTPVTT